MKTPELLHELSHHRAIKLSCYDAFGLFLNNVACCCLVSRCCSKNSPKGLRLTRLYERGVKRLDHDFDAERLVK